MSSVRPTRRCLDDLELRFPPLDVPLHETEHDLIAKAQRLPDEFASGGAERVLAIDDRVWFKVKVGAYRVRPASDSGHRSQFADLAQPVEVACA